MHKLGANTISNVASRFWSVVSIYIFIPFYIKFLGETAYGLVSFFATLQAAMNLLGLGLSNTLRREFAVGNTTDILNGTRKYKLLKSVELIYFGLGLFVLFFCVGGSGYIALNWLNVESLNPDLVKRVIELMGLSIALQMIANLYVGCLFGLELQVKANLYCVTWSALKSIGSLLIIVFVNPDLYLFYLWHVCTDVFYLFLLRLSIKKNLFFDNSDRWTFNDISNLKTIWKYALGLLFISFIALINKQLDKVIISKYLSLTELGAYNIATTLGGGTAILPAAIYTSVFPRFTNKVTVNTSKEELVEEFLIVNRITGFCISCGGAFVAIFAVPLIFLWTRSNVYISMLTIAGPFVVLAIAVAEFQEIPYALALAHGNTKMNVFVGGVFIPIVGFATWFGIKHYGLIGAAVVYMFAMVIQTLVYQYLIFKMYITDRPFQIIIKDTLMPIIFAIALALLFHKLIISFTDSFILQSAFAFISSILSFCLLFVIFGKKEMIYVRRYIRETYNKLTN